jgi:hypothetical protein
MSGSAPPAERVARTCPLPVRRLVSSCPPRCHPDEPSRDPRGKLQRASNWVSGLPSGSPPARGRQGGGNDYAARGLGRAAPSRAAMEKPSRCIGAPHPESEFPSFPEPRRKAARAYLRATRFPSKSRRPQIRRSALPTTPLWQSGIEIVLCPFLEVVRHSAKTAKRPHDSRSCTVDTPSVAGRLF